jgi:hypothetical protein
MMTTPNIQTAANITITVTTFPTFAAEFKLGAAEKVFKKSTATNSDMATNCMAPDSSATEVTSLPNLRRFTFEIEKDIAHSQTVSVDV